MKRTILIFAAILTALFSQSQNISGQWSGNLDMHGREITVVFDIKKSSNGYKSTMYNAEQGKCGLAANSVSLFDSILTIRFTDAKIELFGSLTSENTFLGALKQNNELYPLILNKGKIELAQCEKSKIRRPESVKDVYSYYNEEVVFENKREKMVLVGKLSIPIKKESSPVIILLCGNKLYATENEKKPNTQVEDVVDYLSSCGVAVFHFDSRENHAYTSNVSRKSVSKCTTDVEAIIEYLKTRIEINGTKIKVVDQSNCGLLAQLMAASEGDNLSLITFMVC